MSPENAEAGLPKFTAHVTVCVERAGKTVFRTASASSPESEADARERARALARQRAESAAAGNAPEEHAGTYPYPERVLVEPILERIRFSDTTGDRELARITRNGYAARVINAYRAMFVDVDTVPDTGANPVTGAKIFSRAPVTEFAAMDALAALIRRCGDLAFRVYATRAGLRYLCINREFDPTAPETLALMNDLKADARYVTLCRVQKCFRARLTPKPWRCEIRETKTGGGFLGKLFGPKTVVVNEPGRFATCRFVDEIGTGKITPVIARILEFHDAGAEAHSGKPLA